MKRSIVCIAALLTSLASAGAAAQSPDIEQLQRRLDSVSTLLERSSGAKQIEASGSVEALAQREAARALHKQAAQALQAGDRASASRLLDEAAKTLVQAVRLAAPEQINGQKEQGDFDARMASAKALLDAQKRIAGEKGEAAHSSELIAHIDSLLQRAQQLAAAGKLGEARAPLDQAYLASKAAVANMRGGDTLVRSLKFESKEEEYRYELDRNDTHKMLIQVLLQEKRANAAIDGMVRKALDAAARLRKDAEQQGAAQDFEAGIKTLEESTKELVKAIRGAGVYIPG